MFNVSLNLAEIIDMDKAIGLADAAKLMRGRGGRAASVETLRRWANEKRGCRPQGPTGPQLVLQTIRLGGELLTTPEWVKAFEMERLRLGVRAGRTMPAPERSPAKRERAQKKARKKLQRIGVLPKD